MGELLQLNHLLILLVIWSLLGWALVTALRTIGRISRSLERIADALETKRSDDEQN